MIMHLTAQLSATSFSISHFNDLHSVITSCNVITSHRLCANYSRSLNLAPQSKQGSVPNTSTATWPPTISTASRNDAAVSSICPPNTVFINIKTSFYQQFFIHRSLRLFRNVQTFATRSLPPPTPSNDPMFRHLQIYTRFIMFYRVIILLQLSVVTSRPFDWRIKAAHSTGRPVARR